ncbi:MAG: nitroreductase family protein [Treponema sp.]|jgi:nitroreductase|nr:nitroreductase family protein [Treponema sp.]
MRENETIQTIKRRRSTRSYRDIPVPGDELHAIIEAGMYAPNGSGDIERNIHFSVIQNRDMLREINTLAKETAAKSDMDWLRELGGNDDYNCLYNAPVLILISYNEAEVCAVYDCSAVTQNMLLAAESLGLGSCWLYFPLQAFAGGHTDALVTQLHIPAGFKPFSSLIIGYGETGVTRIPRRTARNIFYA